MVPGTLVGAPQLWLPRAPVFSHPTKIMVPLRVELDMKEWLPFWSQNYSSLDVCVHALPDTVDCMSVHFSQE